MIYSRTRNVLKFYEWLLLLGLIVAGLFSLVWLRSAITALEYNIARHEETKREILREKKELLAQRASLSSLQRIHNLAFKTEGFTFPDRRRLNFIKKKESPRVLSVSGNIKLDELFFGSAERDKALQTK